MTYLHADQVGSTLLATAASGAVVGNNQPRYFVYGRERTPSLAALPTDYTYTGQKQDGSGLVYMNARYYDPLIGQFISPDDIVSDATNLFAYNRFMYVNGNPLRYNDPSGHSVDGPGVSAGGIVVTKRHTYPGMCPACNRFQESVQAWVHEQEVAVGIWVWGYVPQPVKSGLATTGQFLQNYTPGPVKTVFSHMFAPPPAGFELGVVLYSPSNWGASINAAKTAQTLAADAAVASKVAAEGKTVASIADGSIYTLSGWKKRVGFAQGTDQAMELADEIGFSFKVDSVRDRGVPGRFHASHAEAQMAALAPNQAVGVSYKMCPECQRFYSAIAQYTGEAQTVADPRKIYIFGADGSTQIVPK